MNKQLRLNLLMIILLAPLIFGNQGNSAAPSDNTNGMNAFEVHGRLSMYNGNPTFRIWVIGTKRILGIPGGDLGPAEMPEKLEKLFSEMGTHVYADFTVEPLSEFVPGNMQFVRIIAAKRLVVYMGDTYLKTLPEI